MRKGLVLVAVVAAAGPARGATVAEVYRQVRDSVVTIQTLEHNPVPAAHVVQTAESVLVELASGESIAARVVASEVLVDLALLKLERVPTKVVAAKPGDSNSLEIGDEVFVVGAPLGIAHSLSVGHVSGRHDVFVRRDGRAAWSSETLLTRGAAGASP